jgi:hypothetical protein
MLQTSLFWEIPFHVTVELDDPQLVIAFVFKRFWGLSVGPGIAQFVLGMQLASDSEARFANCAGIENKWIQK